MKKEIIKTISKLFIALFLITLFQGCDKWLNVRPESEVGEDEMFKNEQGYIDALYGVYVNMGKTDLYGGGLPLMLDVMGKTFDVSETNVYKNFSTYAYQSNECMEVSDKVWERLYYCIMLSNNILDHLEKADPAKFEYYNYLKGESLALRAFLHYEILKIFAPTYKEMPDYMSIPYKKLYSNDIEPQRTVKDIFNFILADLTEAKNLLANDIIKTKQPEFVEYIKANDDEPEDLYAEKFLLDRKFRMNYYGVLATMARVYLDKGEKQNAYDCANEVINSKQYRFIREEDFIDDPEDSKYKRDVMFNDEIVFGLFSIHVDGFAKTNYFDAGSVDKRAYIPGDPQTEDRFSKIFTKLGDIRILYFVDNSDHRPHQRLLNKHPESILTKQRIKMITLHEMYMIVAECKPLQSIELLNNLATSRRFQSGLTANSGEYEVMRFIAEEYRREYIGEGLFWYTFKRNAGNSFMLELNTEIGTKIKDLVLPLPETEIEHGQRVSEIWK